MLLSTLQMFPNKNFEILGLVEVNTVKTIVDGELKGYTEMLEEARKEATKRLIQQANSL